jgi:hypothetical protein
MSMRLERAKATWIRSANSIQASGVRTAASVGRTHGSTSTTRARPLQNLLASIGASTHGRSARQVNDRFRLSPETVEPAPLGLHGTAPLPARAQMRAWPALATMRSCTRDVPARRFGGEHDEVCERPGAAPVARGSVRPHVYRSSKIFNSEPSGRHLSIRRPPGVRDRPNIRGRRQEWASARRTPIAPTPNSRRQERRGRFY